MGCESSKEKEPVASGRGSDNSKEQRKKKKNGDSSQGPLHANWKNSTLCNNQLRDPLTLAISFMRNPGQFRRACTFTLECWNHTRYLEVPLSCSVLLVDAKRSLPVMIEHLDEVPGFYSLSKDCTLSFTGGRSRIVEAKTRLASSRNIMDLELRDKELLSAGDCWLYGCQNIKSMSFVDLPELTTVGEEWLKFCTSLNSVTFGRLPKLQSVGESWLHYSSSLMSVTFSDLPSLTAVGGNWLMSCHGLKLVTFVDLPELTTVGITWLCDCKTLENVTIERLPKLQSVARYWLEECTSLKTVTFRDLPELAQVGANWLDGCPLLWKASFVRIPKLKVKLEHLELPPECSVHWNISGEEEEKAEGHVCVVCLTRPLSTFVLPCRHLCLCSGCAAQINPRKGACPMCHGPIDKMVGCESSNKTRVVAMYQKYAPEKVASADATLEKYKGAEPQLLEALVKEYGPEPTHDDKSDTASNV